MANEQKRTRDLPEVQRLRHEHEDDVIGPGPEGEPVAPPPPSPPAPPPPSRPEGQ